MKPVYRVVIHGRVLESRDLRKLLARAVLEKRNLDRAYRYHLRPPAGPGLERLTGTPVRSMATETSARIM